MDPRFQPVRPPNLRQKPGVVGNKLVYVPVAKAASSTFLLYFKTANKRPLTPLVRDVRRQFAVVRHPVERLQSAYYFGWHKHRGGNAGRVPFEQWWAFVMVNQRFDMHVEPQIEILNHWDCLPGGNNLVFQLEQMDLWWPTMQEMYPDIFNSDDPGRTNYTKVTKNPVPDHIRAEMEELYADDLKLWESVAYLSRPDTPSAPDTKTL